MMAQVDSQTPTSYLPEDLDQQTPSLLLCIVKMVCELLTTLQTASVLLACV